MAAKGTPAYRESPALLDALNGWRRALGNDFVVADAATFAAWSTATFATCQTIAAVLRPASADEVAACLSIAIAHGVALYPVSGGRNWGLGSRVPVTDGNAILDLGRLKRITALDERLAHVTVEPGVTFRELHAFLASRGAKLFLPAIGGPAEASVVGNIVERGDATGPYADRLANLCNLDVLLPDGERITTGFGRFAGSAVASLSNRAPGPQLDGLFTQSNLGIVLAATLWLSPLPEVLQVFTGKVAETAGLGGLIEALRPLILGGVLADNSVNLWNAYKLLPRLGRYPWRLMGGATPLSLPDHGYAAPWFVSGAIHSPSESVALAQRELIEATLRHELVSLDIANTGDDPGLWQKAGIFVGVPSDDNLATMYWRKPGPRPTVLDPDADRCGVVWICLALPFDGPAVVAAVTMIEDQVLGAGFEPIIGLDCTTARVLHAFVVLSYDRDTAGEDERALACHEAVLAAAAEMGIHPYRLGIQSMDRLDGTGAYGRVIRSIKAALDPKDILAPGRYDASQSGESSES